MELYKEYINCIQGRDLFKLLKGENFNEDYNKNSNIMFLVKNVEFYEDLNLKSEIYKNTVHRDVLRNRINYDILGSNMRYIFKEVNLYLNNNIYKYNNKRNLNRRISEIVGHIIKLNGCGLISQISGKFIVKFLRGIKLEFASLALAYAMIKTGENIYSFVNGIIDYHCFVENLHKYILNDIAPVYIKIGIKINRDLDIEELSSIISYTMYYYVYAWCKEMLRDESIRSHEENIVRIIYSEVVKALKNQRQLMEKALKGSSEQCDNIMKTFIIDMDKAITRNNYDKAIAILERMAMDIARDPV